jgi:hypothetical protein
MTDESQATLSVSPTSSQGAAEMGTIEETAEESEVSEELPANLPVTGAGKSDSGLPILLTVAAVIALLIGFSSWEKKRSVN